MTLKIRKLLLSVKLIGLFIISLAVLLFCYRLTTHTETIRNGGLIYKSFWKRGKVYKQEIYKSKDKYPYSLFLFSRRNVRFFSTPQLKWHPHPTIADEFFIDKNGDGKWDEHGKWAYPEGGYKVEQDNDYDGKFDEEYKIEGIM